MKRTLLNTCFIFIISLGVGADALSAPNESSNIFKVGVIAPLTGDLAEYGVATKNGIELAKSQSPSLFSNISFVYEDDQYDSKKSVAAFSKLKHFDKVNLIFVWGSGPSNAVAPLAESQKFPLISMSIDPAPGLNKKWVIRFANYSAQFVRVLASYLTTKGYKNIGVVKTELAYLNSMLQALQQALPGSEVTVIDSYKFGESDFKSSITKINAKKFDAVGVYLMSGQVSQFYRQAAQQHLSLPTFGTDFFESESEVKSAGGAMNGAVFPNTVVTPWFGDKYLTTFGNTSQVNFAANAFDFAMLVGGLFGDEIETPSNEDVLRRFVESKERPGALGTFGYTSDLQGGNYFNFPIALRQIEGETIK